MFRSVLCVLLVSAFVVNPLWADTCCPNCNSPKALGNETVAVCSDCGQATILGLSIPIALTIATLLTSTASVGAFFALRWLWSRGNELSGVNPISKLA